jgi:hypothetical protein
MDGQMPSTKKADLKVGLSESRAAISRGYLAYQSRMRTSTPDPFSASWNTFRSDPM